MMPENCQATFLGSSGIIFGISRLFFGYKKKPKQGNTDCFRAFKLVFVLSYVNMCSISQHSYHVNHPLNKKQAFMLLQMIRNECGESNHTMLPFPSPCNNIPIDGTMSILSVFCHLGSSICSGNSYPLTIQTFLF